jgi:NADPH:quinone reductase-like Zn-dependent oxidoreductase
MKAFVIKAGSTSFDGLVQVQRPTPAPGHGEILVAMRAASVNFRDLLVPLGRYFGGPIPADLVPLSDGAGEVVALGQDVTRFKVGDRVCGTFFRNYVDGPPAAVDRPALGSPADGVLAEYVVFNQRDAVKIPANLTFLEASTLPCAGVTAWHALMVAGRPLKPGDNVLVLGTGGVSLQALQLARAAGARVLVTSSDDTKLERARLLGASGLINYKANPEWHSEVMRLTDGHGADCVIEVGGAGTLKNSMLSLAYAGKIAMIGVLSGFQGDTNPHPVMLKGGSMHGIFVGNRAMFEQMNRAIEVNDIHPIIDKVFEFNQIVEAFNHVQRQAHFGKVAIHIG